MKIMKNLYSSTYNKKNLSNCSKYHPKSPPITEFYDLEALEVDSQYSSLSSPASSNDLNQCNRRHFNYLSTSTSSSPRSSIESSSLFQLDSNFEKPLTFQEFISSIISNDKQWHKLIIQDLAKLLELNFKEFKKSLCYYNSKKQIKSDSNNNKSLILNSSIYLNIESELFTHIAEKLFELASDEPNGILGTKINLKLSCDDGQIYDICTGFPYDQSTITTTEITITIKESVTAFKKILQSLKLSSIKKYFALHIDSEYFDIYKYRLY